MNVLDLFSGIGGFSLGLERAGMKTVAFCEIDPYAQKVLKKHWPDVPVYSDIRELSHAKLYSDGIDNIDLICGGFPCQPFSQAGERRGKKDSRYIWPEMLRIISETRPAWILAENVVGLITLGLDKVLHGLESIGYTTRTIVIPACAVGAPHKRERVWIIAYSHSVRMERARPKQQTTRLDQRLGGDGWDTQSPVCRVAYGLPSRVERLRCLGNAVVPQIPELIGRAIMNCES